MHLARAFCLVAIFLAASFPTLAGEAKDPLPAWKDGPNKRAIVAFVERVTNESGPDFVAPADRVATFDNDGTLWCEKPTVEVAFTLARLKVMAAKDPSLNQKQPYKAALEGDTEYLHHAGLKSVLELVVATHTDLSVADFESETAEFLKTARHPKFDIPLTACVYQPMLELLAYLRANGFQTAICSGGDIDFIRVFAKQVYGIPRDQVIGSSVHYRLKSIEGKTSLWRLAPFARVNDKEDKPEGIALHLGKQPIFSAGNVRSGGDIAMLTYCKSRKGASLQLLVNHDDADREYAYAEKEGESLKAAREQNWNVVSMKDDWRTIFASPRSRKR